MPGKWDAGTRGGSVSRAMRWAGMYLAMVCARRRSTIVWKNGNVTLVPPDEPIANEEKVRNNADEGSPRWDISQERQFVETILGQRFNFFLVFFALICAGALNAREWASYLQTSILTLGALICFALALAIMRAQHKLDLILAELGKDSRHPFTFINARAGRWSMRWLIGYGVPVACTAALAIAAILSHYHLLGAPSPPACAPDRALEKSLGFDAPRALPLGAGTAPGSK